MRSVYRIYYPHNPNFKRNIQTSSVMEPQLRLWRNWPTLLAKHYCLSPKSAMTLLTLSNDTETNKRVWQAMFAIHFKLTPTTFWPKCINLSKCTKFCSTRKLGVADKSFGLLTKNCLMHWQIRGLKGSISGNICVVFLNL